MNPNLDRIRTQARNVRTTGDGFTCYCPIHESGGGTHNNSLSVTETSDGKILLKCHNGCDAREIVYAFGLTWSDMMPPKNEPPKSAGGRITKTYDYIDADGILRYQVCRIEPGQNGRAKDFRQRQPDGRGGYSWKTKGLKKFPYRLPEMIAAEGRPVFVVEGEKQVDYLRGLGLTATCNPGGAGKWLKKFGEHLRGRHVVAIPDNDPPNEKTGRRVGWDHAQDVAASVYGIAASVRVVELPDAEPKWGLDDWLQAGHDLQELQRLCQQAAEWEPPPPEPEPDQPAPVADIGRPELTPTDSLMQQDRERLAKIGITYVAQNETTGHVEIFSEVTQKFSTIKDPSGLKFEQLVLAAGYKARQMVRRSAEDEGEFGLSEIKISIASLASEITAHEEKRGIGVWESSGCVVVVNSRQLGVLNGSPAMQLTSNPVHLGEAYDIGDRTRWLDLPSTQSAILAADGSPTLYADDVRKLHDLFSLWNYQTPDSPFPAVLAGLVLATFTQTLWHWRPQVFLTGQAYAGKSTMFKMISRIFGPIAKMSSNSSAAGIRQYIGSSGRIVLYDELEKSRYRGEILEMIRASGRGDDSFRGSASQSGHIAFRLQHIFWCAAIESGLTTEADTSRFIVCELQKTGSKLDLPTHDELTALGQRLITASVAAVRAARDRAEFLLSHRPDGVHGRICESYAVPVAMYATTIGLSETESLDLFGRALDSVNEADQVESDSDRLLQDIMHSVLFLPGGQRKTVLQVLQQYDSDYHRGDVESCEQKLHAVGIYPTSDRIFLNRGQIERELLRQTDWQGKRIDTLLRRLPGANSATKRFGKSTLRFVTIPRDAVSYEGIEDGQGGSQIDDSDPF